MAPQDDSLADEVKALAARLETVAADDKASTARQDKNTSYMAEQLTKLRKQVDVEFYALKGPKTSTAFFASPFDSSKASFQKRS